MEPRVFSGRIAAGKLHVRGWRSLDWRDCEVTITVEKKHAIRSLEANRYYFGVCLHLLSEHTGYTVDELHEWAKARFLPKHVALLDHNGTVVDDIVIGGTTTKLNRVQFYEYIESLRQFAAERLDVNIPDPDPDWRETEPVKLHSKDGKYLDKVERLDGGMSKAELAGTKWNPDQLENQSL